MKCSFSFIFFFFNDTATTEIYTLSLHDALPISVSEECGARQKCWDAAKTNDFQRRPPSDDCCLAASLAGLFSLHWRRPLRHVPQLGRERFETIRDLRGGPAQPGISKQRMRSEERRVGKECR